MASSTNQLVKPLVDYATPAYILALKALVVETLGRRDEALELCLEAKDKLPGDTLALLDDKMLSAIQDVCQCLGRMDIAIDYYDHACQRVPKSLELSLGLFNCYLPVSSFTKQQQTALKMYKYSGEEMYLLWTICSIQLQVLLGEAHISLLSLAEGLLKKHVDEHNGLQEPEALVVYISVPEQQGKYDRLRIEGRLLACACDYAAAAADVFMKILNLCNDDWECFLDYIGVLEDDCRWVCLDTSSQQTLPQRFVPCKLDHLSDEKFDSRIAEASEFVNSLPAVTHLMNTRGPYWGKIEIERRRRLFGKDNKMREAIYEYFDRFSHLHSFIFDIEMFLQVFPKDEMLEEPTKRFNRLVTISEIREWFGLIFKLSLEDTETANAIRGNLYGEMLQLSKHLDPQVLCMACNVLVQSLPEPSIQIFVRNITGKSMCLMVGRCNTVALIKENIYHLLGIPSGDQRLIFGGKQLQDACTLGYYGIQEESTLNLSLRLCGGKRPRKEFYCDVCNTFFKNDKQMKAHRHDAAAELHEPEEPTQQPPPPQQPLPQLYTNAKKAIKRFRKNLLIQQENTGT